ncbi:hypothetical protein PC128_g17799 [Phytophthora cactorum]|nr:hypothetical protein PC128_g17799 [Phytophthora cactorum]
MERGRPECETDSDKRDVGGGVNVIVEEIVCAKHTKKPFQLPASDDCHETERTQLKWSADFPSLSTRRRVKTESDVRAGSGRGHERFSVVWYLWRRGLDGVERFGGRSGYEDTPQVVGVGQTNRGR